MANKNLTAKEAIKNFQEAFGYTPQAIIKILECCMTVDVAGCKECLLKGESNCINKIQTLAHDLIKRQQSEVAREIFEEIEKIIRKHDERPKYRMMIEIAELEKKYTEDRGDG